MSLEIWSKLILVEFFAIIVAQYNGELAAHKLNEFWKFL